MKKQKQKKEENEGKARKTVQGILLDLDSIQTVEEKSAIRIFLKTQKGIEILTEKKFRPYCYVIYSGDKEKLKEALLEREFGEHKAKIREIREVKKENEEKVLQLFFDSTRDLSTARTELPTIDGVKEKREYDIIFTKRFLIDHNLEPLNGLEIDYIEEEGKKIIESIKKKEEESIELNSVTLDIETYSTTKFSSPKTDPVLIAALSTPHKTILISTRKELKKEGVEVKETEKELVEGIVKEIKEKNYDVLITYNGDSFDLPYLKERAKVLGTRFAIGTDGSEPLLRSHGQYHAAKTKGIQHFDAYQVIRTITKFGIISLVKYDLESVIEALFGEPKEKLTAREIVEIWDMGKNLGELAEYNKSDAVSTQKIALQYMPLYIEIAKLTKETLYEAGRISASGMVEDLLIDKSFHENKLIPNRPKEELTKKRAAQTFKGGYVKSPEPGLHENIVVLDFRSLHPSIMISHNVSPETLDCSCCYKSKKNLSPSGHYFCEKNKGFLPSVQEELLNKRIKIKEEMKKLSKKDSRYSTYYARQYALKILLNSFYGYLGYPRSRWYSFESAQSVTAWSRHYVREIGSKAEKEEFKILYMDTDSNFLIIPEGKTKEDVEKFVKKINSELPGVMEIEIDGFYKRGIFVTKKEGTAAAKKRYALIDYEGNLKIVGFEYVRRDWAPIAKNTQKKVIELVLKEGKPEKAIETVKEVIKQLKEGKTLKKDLVIYTQIKKSFSHYEAIGPHVAAAKKAFKKGKDVGIGSIIGFIVTKTGTSISDKAELEEFVKEGNYDADYYIEHQVIPAVIKIIQELGYSKEDLIHGGKQATLETFN
ncbi:MAG: DNA-directed DNA polymerase [Candidatus Diapherotrites archaeon]